MPQPPPAQIVPNLLVESVETLRGFYIDQLGFQHRMGLVGKDGKLDFCIVARDGAMVMINRPRERPPGVPVRPPLELYIEARGVDAYHEQVRGRTAITDPLVTQWWGDRNFSVTDPYGYKIWFYENVTNWDALVASGKVPPPGVTLV
jgi:uncharacterized glyoxalase superfamily protein PhnB